MTPPTAIPRTIWYVHYQASPTDGSAVHVAQFIAAFAARCAQEGVTFRVVAPQQQIAQPPQHEPWWRRLRRALGRYYLRELLLLWRQWRRSLAEGRLLDADRPDLVITRYDAETLSIHWACAKRRIPVVTEFNGIDRSELAGTYLAVKQLPWLNRLFGTPSIVFWVATAAGEPMSPPGTRELGRLSCATFPVRLPTAGRDQARSKGKAAGSLQCHTPMPT